MRKKTVNLIIKQIFHSALVETGGRQVSEPKLEWFWHLIFSMPDQEIQRHMTYRSVRNEAGGM